MQAVTEHLKAWENFEVERSASEASKANAVKLRLSDEAIKRYTTTEHDTPYPWNMRIICSAMLGAKLFWIMAAGWVRTVF